MKRGEIYVAELKPRSGSEQQGRRPVIVVSHDGFNETMEWRSVIVVPLSTSAAQARRGPTAVGIAAGIGGLTRDSVAICHQLTTLDRAKLVERLGVLDGRTMETLETGLRAALGLR